MKKIIFILTACILAVVSCDKIDSLLDTKNYQKADTSSFPQTEKDAEQLVNSAYSTMHSLYTGSIFRINLFRRMIASDDYYGGGSTSSKETTAADRLLAPSMDEDNSPWKSYYNGLFRCNFALEAITAMEDDKFTGDNKNWFLGQVHFMRAFWLWELAERYETFPLTLSTEVENMPKAEVDEIYKAIGDDLVEAIKLIPGKYGYSRDNNLAGRATKYAAEALLGRVWLFYTGFYKKSEMAGISKAQVISYLEECANTSVSKFDLEDDPREIWPYTNTYSSGIEYGADFDTYANHENLRWVGNHSKETVWGVHFSLTGNGYNRLPEWIGMRNSAQRPNKDSYPYAPSRSRSGMRIRITARRTSVSTVPSSPPTKRRSRLEILGSRTVMSSFRTSRATTARKSKEPGSIPRSIRRSPAIPMVPSPACSTTSSMP